jgi:hypothetical protein
MEEKKKENLNEEPQKEQDIIDKIKEMIISLENLVTVLNNTDFVENKNSEIDEA